MNLYIRIVQSHWLLIAAGLWSLATVPEAHAQTAELESLQRTNQRVIREAQEHSQPQADVFIFPSETPTPPPHSTPEAPSACLSIQAIELAGHTASLGRSPVLPATPACLSTRDLNALLARLNAHYQAAGWITTRVYVDPKENAAGRLALRVVPGQIETLTLGKTTDDPRKVTAFPEREDRLLNLRDLEQGLENINRLPSQEGRLNLVPGTQNGQTQVC